MDRTGDQPEGPRRTLGRIDDPRLVRFRQTGRRHIDRLLEIGSVEGIRLIEDSDRHEPVDAENAFDGDFTSRDEPLDVGVPDEPDLAGEIAALAATAPPS